MEFEIEEAAYNFYNNYARTLGFSIIRQACHKDSNGNIIDRTFCCSCQGQRRKDKRDVCVKSHRPETRTGCCAKMKINARETGRLKGIVFIASHSGHNLVSPNKSHILRSQRSINTGQASQISNIDKSGIAPKADGQMMADYVYFGDVVCFDTTYRKNKEGRPFALFVCVNHHKQTVIFGASLLYDETAETFMWLFDTFAKAMNGKTPFFQHFRRLVDDRRYEELKADLRTNHSTPVLSFPVEIIKHAVSVYTHETFQLFQNELSKTHDSKLEVVTESEVISHYKISFFSKQYQHTVTYDLSDDKISCSCKRFEFAGLLCSHVLKVFTYKNVMRIPEFYIKKRWTKMAKKWIVETSSPPNVKIEEFLDEIKEEGEKIKIGMLYKELCRLYHQLMTHAALTEETYELTISVIIKAIEEVDMSLENRGTPKQTPNLKVSSEKQILESGCNEVVVKGFKIKPNSRAKSEKQPKSALERAKKKEEVK
ncbi:protein FAR1-RELATED SEQUENCE 5-like [Henckelia pumila]|uniref:protein FAR1-RELATED SEQUENCE 5-like n=1 Tax=Henckelia pumila TaxID=405737 RepID=UPI003C6DF6A3